MGQILALPFDVKKLPGFRFGTLPPDPHSIAPHCEKLDSEALGHRSVFRLQSTPHLPLRREKRTGRGGE